MIASHRVIRTNKLLSSDSDVGSDVQDFPTALWTWEYQNSGDYHYVMDQSVRIGSTIASYRYPGLPCCLVLDNAPCHMGGMINPFVMNKMECAEYLPHAGLRRVYVCRDNDMPLHSFNIPSRGCNFARAPRGPSTEELRQAVFDTSLICYKSGLKIALKMKDGPLSLPLSLPYLFNFQPIELY